MYSNFFAIITLTLSCLLATVRADDTWYAVFTNSSGYSFLDSDNSLIQPTSSGSVATVDASHDKGMRFRFPTGSGGIVVSAAHNDHALGYDSSKDEFHSDFSTSNFDDLVAVTISGSQVTLCNGVNCIGSGGAKTTDAYQWYIQQISSA